MRNRLLCKLLLINILPVIGVIFLVVWLAVDKLAAKYFMELMKIYDVAHELRTPLTNLRGYLEALNDGVIPPLPETLLMLQQENLRLVHLVDNLQQLARADAAKAYLKRENIVLTDLVKQMVELHRFNFQKKGIRVETSWQDDQVRVSADRDKLLQVMQNLLDNCCKYTPENDTQQPGGKAMKRSKNILVGLLLGVGMIMTFPIGQAFAELQEATFVVG